MASFALTFSPLPVSTSESASRPEGKKVSNATLPSNSAVPSGDDNRSGSKYASFSVPRTVVVSETRADRELVFEERRRIRLVLEASRGGTPGDVA